MWLLFTLGGMHSKPIARGDPAELDDYEQAIDGILIQAYLKYFTFTL